MLRDRSLFVCRPVCGGVFTACCTFVLTANDHCSWLVLQCLRACQMLPRVLLTQLLATCSLRATCYLAGACNGCSQKRDTHRAMSSSSCSVSLFFPLARRNVCGDRQNRYCCPGWEQTPGSRTCTKRESLNADKRTSSAKQLVAPVYYEPVFMLQRFVLVAVAAADASDLTSVSAETASSVPPVNKTPVSTLFIIHL